MSISSSFLGSPGNSGEITSPFFRFTGSSASSKIGWNESDRGSDSTTVVDASSTGSRMSLLSPSPYKCSM